MNLKPVDLKPTLKPTKVEKSNNETPPTITIKGEEYKIRYAHKDKATKWKAKGYLVSKSYRDVVVMLKKTPKKIPKKTPEKTSQEAPQKTLKKGKLTKKEA